DIELVDIEHTGEVFDRLVRDLFLCRAELTQRRGRDKANQKPEDGEDDKELEQRETVLPVPWLTGDYLRSRAPVEISDLVKNIRDGDLVAAALAEHHGSLRRSRHTFPPSLAGARRPPKRWAPKESV